MRLHAGEGFDLSSLAGVGLSLLGVGGGVASLLTADLTQTMLQVASPVIAGVGVYLISKDVWETAQARLDEHDQRRPLEVRATAHEGKVRRLVVHNPNDFPVTGAYVRVHKYHQISFPIEFLDTPSEGAMFNWGTHQRSNGEIGAHDSLIVDIVEQRNADYFAHMVPSSKEPFKYEPAWPQPHGKYEIDIVCGSRSISLPRSLYTLDLCFENKDTFTLSFREYAKRPPLVKPIPRPTGASD